MKRSFFHETIKFGEVITEHFFVFPRVARWFNFMPKIPIRVKFWSALEWKMLAYFMTILNVYRKLVYIFYGHFVYFVYIWYILYLFGIFCVYLVYFSRFWYKNLATPVCPRSDQIAAMIKQCSVQYDGL
jgi:hypothetical protein